MSYVIRHKSTGHYLRGKHEWTSELGCALHFNSGTRMVSYLEKTGEAAAADALEVIPVSPTDQPLPEVMRAGPSASV